MKIDQIQDDLASLYWQRADRRQQIWHICIGREQIEDD
ncbi:hypothetical protein F383_34949 [Gossypium arboreum]|uniref:Uncharacterized protein n=1 Tax=Gossypium arboreum TaxID=29729 RepID=A0A0B0PTN3_GOSAR|nr:hypothetical protein F383_34949 [Gossypium arboreum]